MSKCSLFLVDEDLFFNFLSSSYSLVTEIKTKLLKRGAKDVTRPARSAQEHGILPSHKRSEADHFSLNSLNMAIFGTLVTW